MNNDKKFTSLYCDLNHFKIFNDRYGFLKGDEVIKYTARLLLQVVHELGESDDLVGHVGGDDFIILTGTAAPSKLSHRIMERFDKEIRRFYSDKDLVREGIDIMDRHSQVVRYPILGIAIVGVNPKVRGLKNPEAISSVGMELKKYVKQYRKSAYLEDRRKTTHPPHNPLNS